MNVKKITVIFILAVVIIIAAYDVWTFVELGNNDATISAQLIEWSYNYPLVPFLFGIIAGHLWWGKTTLRGNE